MAKELKKRRDLLVYWCNGDHTTFPAVKLNSINIQDKKGRMAAMSFEFGKGHHVAAINMDNMKFFELVDTCTLD